MLRKVHRKRSSLEQSCPNLNELLEEYRKHGLDYLDGEGDGRGWKLMAVGRLGLTNRIFGGSISLEVREMEKEEGKLTLGDRTG